MTNATNPPSQIVPAAQVSGEAVTWRDMMRWAGIIVPISAFAFWAGVQLTGISNAQALMQKDITEIKASVKAHSEIEGHPRLEKRVWLLEHTGSGQRKTAGR